MTARILVSACLLGQPVRYDGRARRLAHGLLTNWRRQGLVVPFCPEIAAGFPTPRPPAEIEPGRNAGDVLAGNGRVLEAAGADVTAGFLHGAELAVALARSQGCRWALLTDGSPSCGSGFVYGGRHDSTRRAGEGVAAAALRRAGIRAFAPDRIDALAAEIGG